MNIFKKKKNSALTVNTNKGLVFDNLQTLKDFYMEGIKGEPTTMQAYKREKIAQKSGEVVLGPVAGKYGDTFVGRLTPQGIYSFPNPSAIPIRMPKDSFGFFKYLGIPTLCVTDTDMILKYIPWSVLTETVPVVDIDETLQSLDSFNVLESLNGLERVTSDTTLAYTFDNSTYNVSDIQGIYDRLKNLTDMGSTLFNLRNSKSLLVFKNVTTYENNYKFIKFNIIYTILESLRIAGANKFSNKIQSDFVNELLSFYALNSDLFTGFIKLMKLSISEDTDITNPNVQESTIENIESKFLEGLEKLDNFYDELDIMTNKLQQDVESYIESKLTNEVNKYNDTITNRLNDIEL